MTTSSMANCHTAPCSQTAIFRIGSYTCGLSIENIQEINRTLSMTLVHDAPDYVSGIINLRGSVVTVIDLGRMIGISPVTLTSQTRNIIVAHDRELIGLLVDSIDDIIDIDASTIAPSPAHLPTQLAQAFDGVLQLGDELVAVLDVKRLLSEALRN